MKRLYPPLLLCLLLLLLSVPELSAQMRSASNPGCSSNCEILRVSQFYCDQSESWLRLSHLPFDKSSRYWVNSGIKLVAYDRNHTCLGEYTARSFVAINDNNVARDLSFGTKYSYTPGKEYDDLAFVFPPIPSNSAYVSVIEPDSTGGEGWYWKDIPVSSQSRSSYSSQPVFEVHSVKHRIVNTEDGEQLRFTIDVTVSGCRGKKLLFSAFLYRKNSDGTYSNDQNNVALSQVNEKGYVYALSPEVSCNSDRQRFQGINLDVPTRRISHLTGSEDYYVAVQTHIDNGFAKNSPDKPQRRYQFSLNWQKDNKYNSDKYTADQMYNLSESLHDGYQKLDWLEAAANAGHIDAIKSMHVIYTSGYPFIKELRPNLDKAEYWAKKYVAKKPYSGLVDNSCILEGINALRKYRSGRGGLTASDYYYLAEIVEDGDYGEPKNLDLAITFMEKAAGMGDPDAQEDLADFIGGIAFDYFLDDDFDNAYRVADRAIRMSGNYEPTSFCGDLICSNGQDYERGGESRNAYECYRLGSAFGSGIATAELARCYAEGIYVLRDWDKAFALIKTAKALGYNDTQGRYYEYQRRINERNSALYANQQQRAEEQFKRQNSSSIGGWLVLGAVVAGIAALCSSDSGSSSSYSSSSSSSSSSSYYNDLYVSDSDIQSTNSYCILDDLHFYGYKNEDHEFCTIVLKNGHDYNLFRLRDTSARSRYFIYVSNIGGQKSRSKRFFATSRDAVDAIEEMDCRFCKWFKNKNGRNATYEEFNDWK